MHAAVGTTPSFSVPPLVLPFAVAGFFAGGLVGFLTRPSVILIGQLPFGTVVTRGAYLTGLDTLLRSAAENSFNQMFMAAVLGALAGAVIGFLVKTLPARR